MLFAWFDGVIYKGWKKPLKADDLYDLNPDNSSQTIIPAWEKNWEKQRKKKLRNAKIPTQINLSIVPTIVQSFGGLFAVATFVRFLNILMQMVSKRFVSIVSKLIVRLKFLIKSSLYFR